MIVLARVWFILARCGAISGLVSLLLIVPAAAGEEPFANWFRYGASAESDWTIVGEPTNPMVVTIRPKGKLKGPVKRILVLYPQSSSAYDIAITKVLNIFAARELNAYFTITNFNLEDVAGKKAIQFAEAGQFDLILSMGSESTAWLYEHFRGSSIPVVSICSKDPVQLGQMKDYEHGSGNNFAFTSLNMAAEGQLTYVLNLKPGLKNLAILVDSKNISAVETQAKPIAAIAREKGVQVIIGSVQDPARAREELEKIVYDAVRAMRMSDPELTRSAFLITGSTSVFKQIRTINDRAGRVPVLSMIPEIVTAGEDTAVLAIGISFESNAHLAAIYGADILDGRAKPGELAVGIVSPPDIAISFLKARQIGMAVPFSLFETATFIYDYDGQAVRKSKNE